MKILRITILVVIVLVIILIGLFPIRSPGDGYREISVWGSDSLLNHPMGLAWKDGFLYVADTENGFIKKFKDDGSLISQWKGFSRPVAVATVRDVIYVADFLADKITELQADGTRISQWGRHGKGEGEFDAPSGIAVDPKGDIYVADFYNHRIQKFTADGKYLLQWGGDGRSRGKLHYPTDVNVDLNGNVYVADGFNHRVHKFTGDGHYLAKWGGIGYGLSGGWPGWFRLAKAVTVDSQGNLYVADAFNNRIQKFTENGKLLALWGGPGSGNNQVNYPAGVAVDPDGHLYVSDFFNNRIIKLEPYLKRS